MRADRDGERARKFSRRSLRAAVVCGVSLVLILLCVVLERVDGVAEWGARNISRPIVWLLGHITSAFPFSLFEIAVAVAAAGALSLIVVAIVYCANGFLRRGLSHLGVLAAVAFSVGAVYTVCTGFNYYRDPAPVPMAEQGEYTTEQYADVGQMFFDDFARLLSDAEIADDGSIVSPYTPDELAEILTEEMKRLDDPAFGGYYSPYTPRFKPMLASELMSDMHLAGITFVPLGEASVNVCAPVHELASTAAHELMHAKGVMNEGEANLVSYWLLVTSDNDFLRLCGMFETAANIVMLAPDDETGEKWREQLKEAGYYRVTEHSADFWSEHDVFARISNFFNDIYLKAQGQSGAGSYGDGHTTQVDEVPVIGEDGKPVLDENGDQVVDTVIVEYSQIQRFISKYYLG